MADVTTRIYELQVRLAQESLQQLRQIQTHAQGVTTSLDNAKSALVGFAKGLASTISIGVVTAKFFDVAKAMDEIGDAAERAQENVEVFSTLASALNLADVPVEALETGFKGLGKSIAEAGKEGSQANRIFSAIGVDPQGKSKREVLLELADAFNAIRDPVVRTNLAVEVFGRSGQAMVPALARGREGIEALEARVKELGGTLTEAGGKAAGDFDKAMKEARISVDGLFRNIATGLLPHLVSLTNQFTSARGEAEGLIGIGDRLGKWIRDIAAEASAGATKFQEWVEAGRQAGKASRDFLTPADMQDKRFGPTVSGTVQRPNDRKIEAGNLDLLAQSVNELVVNEQKLKAALSNSEPEKAKAVGRSNAAAEAAKREAEAKRLLAEAEREQAEAFRVAFDVASRELALQEEIGNLVSDAAKERGQRLSDIVESSSITAQIEAARAKVQLLEEAFLDLDDTTTNWAIHMAEALDVAKAELDGLTTPIKETNDDLSILVSHIDGYGKDISMALADVAVGGKDAKETWEDFAMSFARSITAMIAQILVVQPFINALVSTIQGINFSGMFGGSFSPSGVQMQTAKGAAFSNGRLLKFARGTVVTKPTLFPMASGMGLMGEAGEEGVLPLARTMSGDLGVKTTGAASNVSVTVVNNAPNTKPVVQEGRSKDGGREITVMIEEIVGSAIMGGKFDTHARQSWGISRQGRR